MTLSHGSLATTNLHRASFSRGSRLYRCDEEVRDLLGATRSVDSDLGQRSAGCCGLRAHVRQRRRDQKARSRLGRLARRSVHRRPGSCGTTGCVAERGRAHSINPRRIRIDLHRVASLSISGIAPLASADTFRDVWGLVRDSHRPVLAIRWRVSLWWSARLTAGVPPGVRATIRGWTR